MRRPSPALVVACVALLVALTGTSYATVLNVPRNSVGTPQLKRNAVKPAKLAPNAVRTGHVLNGSLLAADFRPGQLPAGAKGDKGEKGDKGDQGAPGLSGLQVVEASTSLNSDSVKSQLVHCPAGKKATGGGAGSGGAGAPSVAVHGVPYSDTGWSTIGREIIATAGTWRLTAYVVCANVS